ncbi:MAG: hypothetical protein JXA03_02250 [Bacteroidales bacterium]|nr:hypothetical protein [Bacteroidales bacterium]
MHIFARAKFISDSQNFEIKSNYRRIIKVKIMKKIIRLLTLILILSLSPLFIAGTFADEPPNPGGGPGSGDLPVGGSSPLGSGIAILLSLGAGYGIRKAYLWREKS